MTQNPTPTTDAALQLSYETYKRVTQNLAWACEGWAPSHVGQLVECVEASGGYTHYKVCTVALAEMNLIAIHETEPLFIARSSERHKAASQIFSTVGIDIDRAMKQLWQGAACELLITDAKQSWVVTVNESGGIGFVRCAAREKE